MKISGRCELCKKELKNIGLHKMSKGHREKERLRAIGEI